jgi:hypothetical protein
MEVQRSKLIKNDGDVNNNNNINDPLFEHKLDLITAGFTPFIKAHLLDKISRDNCQTIINYILVMQTETRLADTYRFDTIHKLKQLAQYHHPKSFHDLTRQDIVEFLDRYRKPESVDHFHKLGRYV